MVHQVVEKFFYIHYLIINRNENVTVFGLDEKGRPGEKYAHVSHLANFQNVRFENSTVFFKLRTAHTHSK